MPLTLNVASFRVFFFRAIPFLVTRGRRGPSITGGDVCLRAGMRANRGSGALNMDDGGKTADGEFRMSPEICLSAPCPESTEA